MGWVSDLWFVCDGTVRFWCKGPVQTSNFSCAEANYQIRHVRSATYESIRFVDRFVFGSTRQSNRTAKVGHRFTRRTCSRAESNLHTYFSNLSTAFMIGCIVSCDTWRELTEAWWPFRSRNGGLKWNMLELDPPLKTADFQLALTLSIYSFLTCTSIWSRFPWT